MVLKILTQSLTSIILDMKRHSKYLFRNENSLLINTGDPHRIRITGIIDNLRVITI
jgi:hypothetical protein